MVKANQPFRPAFPPGHWRTHPVHHASTRAFRTRIIPMPDPSLPPDMPPVPRPPRVIVDADACPFKDDILELTAEAGIEVLWVSNPHHEMPVAIHARHLMVDHRDGDAADFAVVNHSRAGDVAITQDTGLAAMLLPRGVTVLSPRGVVYRAESLDGALARRHEIRKLRRRGQTPRGGGPPALREADRLKLRRALAEALKAIAEADAAEYFQTRGGEAPADSHSPPQSPQDSPHRD
jgi:hypothetical protein